MGRGDRKTRKGKIAIRSYGNARPHAAKKAAGTKPAATKSASKTPAKKAAGTKPAATKSPSKTPLKKAAPVKKTAAKKSA